MVLFSLEVEESFTAKQFFNKTRASLIGGDLITNPFSNGFVKVIDRNLYVIGFKPVYPQVWWWGLIWVVMANFFGFGNWYWLVAGALFAQALFFISPIYILMAILGLRKAGYKGKVRIISKAGTIRRLV